jgi:hypothetical protein
LWRKDGTGYPAGLKGDEICREARILAVADVVEAITAHRIAVSCALCSRIIVTDDTITLQQLNSRSVIRQQNKL